MKLTRPSALLSATLAIALLSGLLWLAWEALP